MCTHSRAKEDQICEYRGSVRTTCTPGDREPAAVDPTTASQGAWLARAARGIPQPRLSGTSLGTGTGWGWAGTSAIGQAPARRSLWLSRAELRGAGARHLYGVTQGPRQRVVSIWYENNIIDFIHREEILFRSYVVGENSWHLVRRVSVHGTFLWTLSPVC